MEKWRYSLWATAVIPLKKLKRQQQFGLFSFSAPFEIFHADFYSNLIYTHTHMKIHILYLYITLTIYTVYVSIVFGVL